MPRRRRLFAPGAYYHIIQRGVNCTDIFVDEADRHEFLRGLAVLPDQFGHRVHAYCFMNNHVHLALQCGDQPLGRALRSLFGRYALRFNQRHDRSGHLFQERHKAIMVASDGYLLELIRYIHLNPVRAGIVSDPKHWSWSSYGAYLEDDAPSWLTTDCVLERFAGDAMSARRELVRFTWQGVGMQPVLDFQRGNARMHDALVPDGYHVGVFSRSKRRAAFSRSLEDTEFLLCARLSLRPEDLTGSKRKRGPALARGGMAYLSQWGGGWTIAELAGRYACSESAMSAVAKTFRQRLTEDGGLQALIAEITHEHEHSPSWAGT